MKRLVISYALVMFLFATLFFPAVHAFMAFSMDGGHPGIHDLNGRSVASLSDYAHHADLQLKLADGKSHPEYQDMNCQFSCAAMFFCHPIDSEDFIFTDSPNRWNQPDNYSRRSLTHCPPTPPPFFS